MSEIIERVDDNSYNCYECGKMYVLPVHCNHYAPILVSGKLDRIIELLEYIMENTIDIEKAIYNTRTDR